MKVEVLRDISRGVSLKAGQGHLAALHGLCRRVPPCQSHRGPAPARPISCRRTINVIRVLWNAITNVAWFQTVVT